MSKDDPERSTLIRKTWRNWALAFIPLLAALLVAQSIFGFKAIMPVLIGVLIVVLCYQRVVNKRSWHSIMWGVYATKE